MRMLCTSPRMTAFIQTLAWSPSSTSPITWADSSTYTRAPSFGMTPLNGRIIDSLPKRGSLADARRGDSAAGAGAVEYRCGRDRITPGGSVDNEADRPRSPRSGPAGGARLVHPHGLQILQRHGRHHVLG